ncbi:MAG TPA: hypothetical protein VGK33_05870 [Chloroflexota bacterium]
MKTIFISVQTGMVVRDVLRCGVLDRILSQPETRVVLLTPGARDPAFCAEFGSDRVHIVPQLAYAPSTMVWRLMLRRWRHARSAGMADAVHRLEERLVSVPDAYTRLFDEYQPALVVSGDPLRPGDANLIAAARQRGVPSLGSVRSWDNIQKHLRTRPDALSVWHARNAREAVEIDRYRPHQVRQVGAPQLDVYFRAPRSAACEGGIGAHETLAAIGRGAPQRRHETADGELHSLTNTADALEARPKPLADLGLDPRKRTLLLATSSFTYDSDQTYLVDMLIDAIRDGQIRHPLQIVLRLHPDDRVGRYLKYRRAPEVLLDVPDRYLATLGWTMTTDDLARMAALLRAADVMVNFATTVTLEAAIVDTPTLLVAFSPIDPDEMQRYVVGLHFKMHYRDLVERDLVPVAWNRDQLVGWINRYLDDPALYRDQRASIVREWVQFTDGCSGQRLGDEILRQAGLQPPVTTLAKPTPEFQCAPR